MSDGADRPATIGELRQTFDLLLSLIGATTRMNAGYSNEELKKQGLYVEMEEIAARITAFRKGLDDG